MPALKYLLLTPDWMVALSIVLTVVSAALSALVWRALAVVNSSLVSRLRKLDSELAEALAENARLRVRTFDLEREYRETWREYQSVVSDYAATIPDDPDSQST